MRTRLTPSLLPLRGLQRRANSSLSERLHHELTSRRLPLTYDYLNPLPSHLLNLTLCDLLPPQAAPSHTQQTLPSITNPSPLPIGHHLIYFPPQVTLSQLLPDGTDVLHTPGSPFDRRLWAGGNLRFPLSGPPLDGSRAVCIESIRNVVVKGREGEEKVVVTIERRVGSAPEEEDPNGTWKRIWKEDETCPGESAVIENRDLIFMRSKTAAQVLSDREQFDRSNRFVRPPSNATFRHAILPTESLLFRFSAMTFNAHRIHLDKDYTQTQEGYRNLLVHGPLTLTLLLSVLQSHLKGLSLQTYSIEYKNLAPLFVQEEFTVCGKPKHDNSAWDVWIESPNGGLAVRGTAKTGSVLK